MINNPSQRRQRQAHHEEVKEFEEEVIQIDRVTRVVKGGRRLRFRATVVIGDKRGRVGFGIGKANEVTVAIKKAVSQAKKHLIRVPITKSDSIPHKIQIKFKAATVLLIPAGPGTGIIAGGAIRKVAELAGIKNLLSKELGAVNRLNNAQATLIALKKLREISSLAKNFKKEEEKKHQKMAEKITEKMPEKKVEQKEEKKMEIKPKKINKKEEEEESIEKIKKKLIHM